MTVKINGDTFNVGVASLSRSIRRNEKYRVTTEDGRTHREVQSTYIDFSLSLGNFGKEEYDRLMSFLRSSIGDVSVELPKSYKETETYTGAFEGISDELITEDNEGAVWDNLTLNFTGTEPVEV